MGKRKFDVPRKLNRIQEELIRQERSMLWLAKKTEMSYQTIHDYCNNLRQPNLVKLKIIAIVLGVKISDLINDD